MKKIALIRPAVYSNIFHSSKRRSLNAAPPLGLGILAALTPPDFDVVIIDESFEEIEYTTQFDLVGISVLTPAAFRAYHIADSFRSLGTTVVLGGVHVTVRPDEASEHADSIVVGEAETVWLKLIQDWRAKKLLPRYVGNPVPIPDAIPVPRRDIFKAKPYLFKNTIQASRGCPHNCTFCMVPQLFGRKTRYRSVGSILREIDQLDSRIIGFVDDNLVAVPSQAYELFYALRSRSVKWVSQMSLTIAENERLLDQAADSGCVGIGVGFESIVTENLASVGKHISRVERFLTLVNRIHQRGIAVEGNFIFGFDHDEEKIFEATVQFAKEAHLELANFYILTPYPGTLLYQRLDAEGRIVSNNWADYTKNQAVFIPKLMSRETLEAGTEWARREFYSLSSIYSRVGFLRRHVIPLWGMNLMYRTRATCFSKILKLQVPDT